MRMSMVITPDIEMVLRMMAQSGGKAALVVGFLPGVGIDTTGLYINADKEISSGITGLLESGINSFFFTRWSRFESVVLECLRNSVPAHETQTILMCDHQHLYLDSDPEGLFDKVFWTDVLEIEHREIMEALMSYCGTLAFYDREGMPSINELVEIAKEENKKSIDLAIVI